MTAAMAMAMAPGEAGLSLGAEEQYVREVHATAPLTEEEEVRLLACVFGREERGGEGQGQGQEGRQRKDCETTVSAARVRLIAGYQPLIVGIARRQVARARARVLAFLDLVQEGNVGLLEALARYPQMERPLPFHMWACAAIRRAMRTALARESATYVPLRKSKAIHRVQAEQAHLWTALGRSPTEQEIASALDLSLLAVREALALAAQRTVSLDALLGASAGEGEHARSLESGLFAEPLDDSASPLGDYLASLVARLPARERQAIALGYGFADGASHSYQEVATLMGLSPARVKELDRQARQRLRKALRFLAPRSWTRGTSSTVAQTSALA